MSHSVHFWCVGCRDVPVSVEGFLQVAPQIVSWQGISCTVPQGRSGQQRKILHSISGVAAVTGEDGQLMPCLFAVLGPSGAGKTTFMDILSGRKRDPGKTCKPPFLPTPCLAVAEVGIGIVACMTDVKREPACIARHPSHLFCWCSWHACT